MDFHDVPRFLGKSGMDLMYPPKLCAALRAGAAAKPVPAQPKPRLRATSRAPLDHLEHVLDDDDQVLRSGLAPRPKCFGSGTQAGANVRLPRVCSELRHGLVIRCNQGFWEGFLGSSWGFSGRLDVCRVVRKCSGPFRDVRAPW